MLRVLASLVLIGIVCGNLRGGGGGGADNDELMTNDLFYGHKESLKIHEASVHDLIDSVQDTLLYKMKSATTTPKHITPAYNGGFLVSRKSSVECAGEGTNATLCIVF